ncbi:8947_t:CDS:1, partial [Ambispora leptoticha]
MVIKRKEKSNLADLCCKISAIVLIFLLPEIFRNFKDSENLVGFWIPLSIYLNNNGQIEKVLQLGVEIELFSRTNPTKILSKYTKIVGLILLNEDIEEWR